MAITWTPTVERVRSIGDVKMATYQVSSGAGGTYTYTDNGDSLTFAQLGMVQVEFAVCGPAFLATRLNALLVEYDITNQKVVLYGGAAANTELAELTAAKDIATLRLFKMFVIGKGPVVGPGM